MIKSKHNKKYNKMQSKEKPNKSAKQKAEKESVLLPDQDLNYINITVFFFVCTVHVCVCVCVCVLTRHTVEGNVAAGNVMANLAWLSFMPSYWDEWMITIRPCYAAIQFLTHTYT